MTRDFSPKWLTFYLNKQIQWQRWPKFYLHLGPWLWRSTRRDQGWMNTKWVREELALRIQNGGLTTQHDMEKRCESFLIWPIFDQNINLQMCGSRKYPYPHHGENWKFRGGGGVKDPGNSRGQGGWTIDFVSRCPSIQYDRSSCSKILYTS